jgi:acyl-CoA dehydrogenase
MTSDIERSVERLFADHGTSAIRAAAETGVWPTGLWQALVDAGLPGALVADGDGGIGITEAFGIVRLTGRHALPVPLAETLLANWMLARCGLPTTDRPAVVVVSPNLMLKSTKLSGMAANVPWGRLAELFAVVEHGSDLVLVCVDRNAVHATKGANIALEPRDTLIIDCDETSLIRVPSDIDARSLRAAGAALRCAQMAGAMEAALVMTVKYATERVQFGRPIAKFQAVQHSIAMLAEQTAAARAAADLAAEAFGNGIDLEGIATAKTFVSEAAGVAAGIAHQIHGAMGFTKEYGLHFLTRRLWSWREEYGNDSEWSEFLGRRLAAGGADQLWAGITSL